MLFRSFLVGFRRILRPFRVVFLITQGREIVDELSMDGFCRGSQSDAVDEGHDGRGLGAGLPAVCSAIELLQGLTRESVGGDHKDKPLIEESAGQWLCRGGNGQQLGRSEAALVLLQAQKGQGAAAFEWNFVSSRTERTIASID